MDQRDIKNFFDTLSIQQKIDVLNHLCLLAESTKIKLLNGNDQNSIKYPKTIKEIQDLINDLIKARKNLTEDKSISIDFIFLSLVTYYNLNS